MNPETVLVAWLRAHYEPSDVKRVVTERPADLTNNLPLLQVVSIGGQDPAMTWSPRQIFAQRNVDIDVLASTREAARELAERVNTALLDDLPGARVGTVGVISVQSILAPLWTADDNTDIRRFVLTVSLRLQDGSAP